MNEEEEEIKHTKAICLTNDFVVGFFFYQAMLEKYTNHIVYFDCCVG